MPSFNFDRECRTAFSECFTVLKGNDPIGRADIHFADSAIHATVNVNETITQEEIQDLIDMIDQDLLDSVGIRRQEGVIVHVHQGRDLGVFSTREEFTGNGGHEHRS